tara:strand:- start:9680 stop:11395 length:1716 start_codon:yes stop_codon:yes gene_type:complete
MAETSTGINKVVDTTSKAVKQSETAIVKFTRFLKLKTTILKRTQLPKKGTISKAEKFIKNWNPGKGGKAGGDNKFLKLAAGAAILTMGTMHFMPAQSAEAQTNQVLNEQYGGDKAKMIADLKKEKKLAKEGADKAQESSEGKNEEIDKQINHLEKSQVTPSDGKVSLGDTDRAKQMQEEIHKKTKIDVDKFDSGVKGFVRLIESKAIANAMGPGFFESVVNVVTETAGKVIEGTKRGIAGAADFLTGNIFDFDKKNTPKETVDDDGIPRADGVIDENKLKKVKVEYKDATEIIQSTTTVQRDKWMPPNETLIAGPPMAGGSGSLEEQAFVQLTRELEGTKGDKAYSRWFGGRDEMDMTNMTLQEVYDEQTRRMNAGETTYNGLKSAAVGVGQFMDPLTQVKEMYQGQGRLQEFDPTKIKFDKNVQHELLMDLAKRKRKINVSKELTKQDFDILQQEWASFGPYHGQTTQTTTETKARYDEILKGLRDNQVKVPGDQAALPPSQYPSYNQRGSVNNTVMMIQQAPPQRSNDIPAQIASVPGGGGGAPMILPMSHDASAEEVGNHILLTSLTG